MSAEFVKPAEEQLSAEFVKTAEEQLSAEFVTAPLVELSFWYSPPATQGSGQPERRTAIGRAPKCGSGRRTALCERHSADADDGAPVRDRAQR